MHSYYYSTTAALRAGQLASWDKYRELELQLKQNAVTEAGDLLEYETLELRIHPPNVRIDNNSHEDRTVLIIDSANRPGTLVEVVQCLTELGLSVKQARISSDGGWFVDEFHVSETPSGRITDPKKLDAIKSVLSLPDERGEPSEVHTVFQIAGPESPGILAEITQLLAHNGLEIRTAAAWTYNKRAAIVLGVTQHSAAVADHVKLHRLKQLLVKLVEKKGDAAVSVEQVEGPVHHERRLHQLLLADEIQAWKQLSRLQRQHSLPFPGPINTNLTASDTDPEADQTPRTPQTPQQQWQRQMLPPTWTVDPKGKPVLRDDPIPRHNTLQLQQQHSQEALDDAAAAAGGAATAVDAEVTVGKAGVAGLLPQRANVHTTSLPPLPAENKSMAVVAARDGGAAARDSAAAAAAAAQQASVDKLIALLQPQPLAHALPLPKAHVQQQQQLGSSRGIAAAPEGGSPEQQTATKLTRSVSSNSGRSLALDDKQGPSVLSALSVVQAGAVNDTSDMPTTPASAADLQQQQQQRGGHLGLPPRAPGATSSAGLSSTGLTAATALPAASLVPPGSASAPTSPIAPKPAGSSRDQAAANALLSPGRFASAAAAAGQLSPRAFSRADSTPVPSSGSMFGTQQHLLQSGQLAGHQGSVSEGASSPHVNIQHSSLFNYWLVTIRCRDRNKLFFDTVCTLCDMRYDIYHATIDGESTGSANQLFYIRPRFGACDFDEHRASVLKAMLVSAVQRRFPQGLRVHVFTGSTVCLQDLFNSMRRHGLTITRCKVRAFDNTSHTFYLLNQDGSLPSKQYVRQACQAVGGELVEAPLDVSNPCVATVLRSLDARGRFAFSFVNKRHLNRLAAAPATPEVVGAVPFVQGRGTAAHVSGVERSGRALFDDGGAAGGKRGSGAIALMRGLSGHQQLREGTSATGPTSSYSGSDQQPSF